MHLTNDEDVAQFCDSEPTAEDVNARTVHELKLIVEYLGGNCDVGATKVELVAAVMAQIYGGPEAGDPPAPADRGDSDTSAASSSASVDNLDNLKLQLELARVQLAHAKEQTIKARLDAQARRLRPRSNSRERRMPFDVTRYLKMVPPFSEAEPEIYFRAFERVADSMSWPREYWPVLIQSVLKGRAQSVYAALPAHQANDYDLLKGAILQAYEFVPEVYRQRFRASRKQTSQTHGEFARVLRDQFQQWLRAEKVTDFKGLSELVLLEKYKGTVSREISVYLHEKEVKDLESAATLAENFDVLHRSSLETLPHHMRGRKDEREHTERRVLPARDVHQAFPHQNKFNPQAAPFVPYNSRQCTYCGQPGHLVHRCWKRDRDLATSKPVSASLARGMPPVRNVADATGLRRDAQDQARPVNLVSTFSGTTGAGASEQRAVLSVVPSFGESEKDQTLGNYHPFLSRGSVRTQGGVAHVQILRDSGALQSLMLRGLAPVVETGQKISIHSLWGAQSVPLVEVVIECDLVRGPVLVGLVDRLPIPGVDFVLGNDLAGGRMSPPAGSDNNNPCAGHSRGAGKSGAAPAKAGRAEPSGGSEGIVADGEELKDEESLGLGDIFCLPEGGMEVREGEEVYYECHSESFSDAISAQGMSYGDAQPDVTLAQRHISDPLPLSNESGERLVCHVGGAPPLFAPFDGPPEGAVLKICTSYSSRISPVAAVQRKDQEEELHLPPQRGMLEERPRAYTAPTDLATPTPQLIEEKSMGDTGPLCDFLKGEADKEDFCNFESGGEWIFLCMRAVLILVSIFTCFSDCMRKLVKFITPNPCNTTFSPLLISQRCVLVPPAEFSSETPWETPPCRAVTAGSTCHSALRSRPRINGRPPDLPPPPPVTDLARAPHHPWPGLSTCRSEPPDRLRSTWEYEDENSSRGIFW